MTQPSIDTVVCPLDDPNFVRGFTHTEDDRLFGLHVMPTLDEEIQLATRAYEVGIQPTAAIFFHYIHTITIDRLETELKGQFGDNIVMLYDDMPIIAYLLIKGQSIACRKVDEIEMKADLIRPTVGTNRDDLLKKGNVIVEPTKNEGNLYHVDSWQGFLDLLEEWPDNTSLIYSHEPGNPSRDGKILSEDLFIAASNIALKQPVACDTQGFEDWHEYQEIIRRENALVITKTESGRPDITSSRAGATEVGSGFTAQVTQMNFAPFVADNTWHIGIDSLIHQKTNFHPLLDRYEVETLDIARSVVNVPDAEWKNHVEIEGEMVKISTGVQMQTVIGPTLFEIMTNYQFVDYENDQESKDLLDGIWAAVIDQQKINYAISNQITADKERSFLLSGYHITKAVVDSLPDMVENVLGYPVPKKDTKEEKAAYQTCVFDLMRLMLNNQSDIIKVQVKGLGADAAPELPETEIATRLHYTLKAASSLELRGAERMEFIQAYQNTFGRLLSDSMIQSGRWISDRYGHNSKFVGLSIDLSNDGKPTIQRDDNGNVQLYSYDMLTRPGLWEIDLSFLLDGPSNLPVGMKERLFDAARYLQIALTHDDIDFESTESKAKNYVLTGNRQNLDRLMTSEAHFAYHNVLECARVHRNILQRKHETKEGGAHKGHYEDLAFEAFMRVYENAESIWNHAGVFDDLNTVARYFFGASDSFDSDLIKAAAQEADLTNQIPFSEY